MLHVKEKLFVDKNIFQGHIGIGKTLEGVALVANDNFSARYDLNRKKGIFSRRSHKLFNQSYVNKILVLNVAKGGVATAWMLKSMVDNQMAPKGLLLNAANPIIAQGAAHANMVLIDRFNVDITVAVNTGDKLRLKPESGTVEILT